MKATQAFLIVLVVGAIAAAGVFTFVPGTRPGFVQGWFRQAKGLTPARTPQEALDRFRAAIQQRDYESAALYCDDKYAEQLKRAAPQAKSLGDAIDSLRHNMKSRELKSPKVEHVLRLLEPFPTQLKAIRVRENGNKATAQFVNDDTIPAVEGPYPDWIIRDHGQILMAFVPTAPGWSGEVELFREGEGEKAVWKIRIPVTDRLRLAVDRLRDRGGNYKNAIEVVRNEVKRDASTQTGVEKELEQRLSESK